ncbi:hypothetical protein E0485_13575 [Paenibacillus albiflavus]|uniref:Aminoglycoside phosphotransferase domain-containing protein n=1 Tax=Paenibacillus albiflavus TaxID=2545760 RepID=A0A4R4E9S6_9BACL|nr:hypothetical protein E0485_13575 [Paenibacillus albiflavus]
MEYMEGEPLRSVLTREDNPSVRYKLIFQYGRQLRELHATICPDQLRNSGDWIDDMLTQAEYNLLHYQVDGTREQLDKLKNNKPKAYRQTLIHGDFTIDNVLVHDGRIAGIIDWSGGALGDPRYDVSLAIRPKPNIFQTDHDHQAFFDGYGETIITDDDYKYFENGLYAFF